MADVGIRWETVTRVSRDTAVVTGEEAGEEGESEPLSLRWTDKPLLIYVCDEDAGCEGFDKLEEVVLKDEKIGLGMKAFRTMKMHPDNVDEDPLIAEEGKGVPRMILIEPVSMKTTVLEQKRIKTSSLYRAMKKVAGKFYKQKLDKIVKTHLKLLGEQDKLANAEKTLKEKKGRLDEGDEAKAKKLDKELEELKVERTELLKKKAELWQLTPKKRAA
jgi:hypothetical protein